MILIKPQRRFGKCFKEIKEVYIQQTTSRTVVTVCGVLPCNRGVELGQYFPKEAERIVKQISSSLSEGGAKILYASE